MRGAFHSGFLARCREQGLLFDKYIGSSSGFYACLASIAELDYKGFWSDQGSPLYQPGYRRNFFKHFVDFHMPKILKETPLEHDLLLSRLNDKLYAMANKISWSGLETELISGYDSFDEVNQAQLASGAIPWLLKPFPHLYKGNRYVDGCFWNRNPARFLDTEIKVVLEPSIEYAKPKKELNIFYHKCDYGKRLKTMIYGTPDDYESIWECGNREADKFLEQLDRNI